MKGDLFKVFEKEWAAMRRLQKYADMDGVPHTMCHNDINIDNILVTDTTLDIIDWEFAGYNDPAMTLDELLPAWSTKWMSRRSRSFWRPILAVRQTQEEYLHWMAYSAIHNWYYVGWALYKESIKESSRDWMLFFYKQAKKTGCLVYPPIRSKVRYSGRKQKRTVTKDPLNIQIHLPVYSEGFISLFTCFQVLHQHGGDIFAGGLDGHRADLMGHAGHTVHNAGFLVLPDGVGAGVAHLQKAAGAVPAHARHDDAHHMALYLSGHGGEQRVPPRGGGR